MNDRATILCSLIYEIKFRSLAYTKAIYVAIYQHISFVSLTLNFCILFKLVMNIHRYANDVMFMSVARKKLSVPLIM